MSSKTVTQRIISDQTLQLFLSRIVAVRPLIQKLILFGSRARGNASPDSDFDILVVVPLKTDGLLDALYDAVMETLLSSGRLISLKIFTVSEYERLRNLSTPFMRRIQAEGVAVG